ncbi:uncharacterized protein PG986_008701 [Apiospora aurea]|uniref:2EXR domain-containing protein n=1 Tax=Apiospora aurea TaxID=335848 RepID=A0ABR1Q5U6_9PEZI
MSSFPCFERLPLELRQMIWHEALNQEVDSRMIIVHRNSMRVMPHPSNKSVVMNTTRASRRYATKLFFDVHLKVRNLHVDYDAAAEIMKYGDTIYGWRAAGGRDALEVARGHHGEPKRARFAHRFWRDHVLPKIGNDVDKLLQTAPNKMDRVGYGRSGRVTGTIFLSSKRDRFALTSTKKCRDMPWDLVHIEICARAIIRDQIYHGYSQVLQDNNGLNFNSPNYTVPRPENWESEFVSRNMTGLLPKKIVRRIRWVVHLRTIPQETSRAHTCGASSHLGARDWKLGSFKNAQELYTADLTVILSSDDLGARNVLKWKKNVREGGSLSFTCMCSHGQEDDGEDDNNQGEIQGEAHSRKYPQT